MTCEYCTPKYRPLFESTFWRVYLDPDQRHLGRCRVILKCHAGTLSMLTAEEWRDFGQIVRRVEAVLEKAFEPELFNWTCMVNNAYLADDPDPHIHWHARPRYRVPVNFAGVTFHDDEFGHHYGREQREVSEDVRRQIREAILHYA